MKRKIGAVLFCLLTASVFGKTIYVGGDSKIQDIQKGIDSAAKGDIVVVSAGFYETSDKLVIDNKSNITLRGEGQVDIVCNLLAHVLEITNSNGITIDNLHMVHSIHMNTENAECGQSANVIEVSNSNFVTVTNCELNGCGYIGINALDCPNLTVIGNYIHSNTYYGIIYALSEKKMEKVVIKNNRMINNANPIFYNDMDLYEDTTDVKNLEMSGNLIYPRSLYTW